MVGEVRFAHAEQAGDGGLQVVVHPQPAHGVVAGRVDAHGHAVRVLGGDPLVHLEQGPVQSEAGSENPREPLERS